MRLTRPRFTLRRMMALVAVISLILGAEIKWRNWGLWSGHWQEKARFHRAKAAGARGTSIDAFDTPPGLANDEVSARYHDQLEQKCEEAASHPGPQSRRTRRRATRLNGQDSDGPYAVAIGARSG